MDYSAIVTAVYTILQNYLPLLAASAAQKLGEQLPVAVFKLWSALKERCTKKPAANEALLDLLKNPDDLDVQGAFRRQLRKLLEEDISFASEIKQLVEVAQTTSIESTVVGHHNPTSSALATIQISTASPTPGAGNYPVAALVECPICGKSNLQTETFRCKQCNRSAICLRHQDKYFLKCSDCMTSWDKFVSWFNAH